MNFCLLLSHLHTLFPKWDFLREIFFHHQCDIPRFHLTNPAWHDFHNRFQQHRPLKDVFPLFLERAPIKGKGDL